MPGLPQQTVRVAPERSERWKQACATAGVTVSEKLRELMDAFADEVLGPQGDDPAA